MSHPPQDELLSAYLDGEITADEQAEIERRLASDPHFRRLYEDFRRLRGNLETLPQLRLPDDFSQRVLRAAEQRMLSGDADRSSQETSPGTSSRGTSAAPSSNGRGANLQLANPAAGDRRVPPRSPEQLVQPESWRERLRRPLAWSLVTVAAALLIMLFNRDGSDTPTASNSANTANTQNSDNGTQHGGGLAISARNDGTNSSQTSDTASAGRLPPEWADVRIRVTPDGFAADGLLVVNCDVTAKAYRGGAFRKLLKEQRIAWETDDAAVGAEKDSSASGEVQVVYVEASSRQIELVLAGLNSQAAAFPTVALVPVPGAAWQHSWQARYERHGHPMQYADSVPEEGPKPDSGKPRKGVPLKGPAIDANAPKQPTEASPGRAWSVPVPVGRGGDAQDSERPEKDPSQAASTGADQEAESAMLRVLFVLRVLSSGEATGD